MPRVQIDKLTIEAAEIDLPLACPGCGARFDDEDAHNLREDGYVSISNTCNLSDGAIEDYAGDETTCSDADIVTGYRCTCCDLQIVGTVA